MLHLRGAGPRSAPRGTGCWLGVTGTSPQGWPLSACRLAVPGHLACTVRSGRPRLGTRRRFPAQQGR